MQGVSYQLYLLQLQHVRPALPAWLPSAYQQLREHFVCEMKKKEKNNNSSHLPTCQDDDQQTFFDGPENHFLVAKSTFQLTPGLGQ